MGNLIKILAASVGGGLVLGAGIRLGEAMVARETGTPAGKRHMDSAGHLAGRLGAIENRLQSLENGLESAQPAAIAVRFDAQEAELAAVRAQLKKEQRQIEELGGAAGRLRGELQDWLETSVSTRMSDVETRLKAESERSQRQMLDAFVESVQTRVIQRISGLEEEVSSQSAAMSELRACSLRTEQSMQRLLTELGRVVVRHPAPEEPARTPPLPFPGTSESVAATSPDASEADPPLPPSLGEPRRRSRWNIFG